MASNTPPFADRRDAGRALADRLADHAAGDTVVLGLPRGGVLVAAEVAAALLAPLDLVVVRKVGVPGHPELAMGAIAAADSDVETVRNEVVLHRGHIDEETFRRAAEFEVHELRRREQVYRQGRAPARLTDRRVIVVDDGLATGATMRAAIAAVRRQRPRRLAVAVPVASPRACADAAAEVDDVVCLWAPDTFSAVGQAYRNFSPTTDDEVRRALAGAPSAG